MKVAAEIFQVILMSVLSLIVLFIVTRLGGKRQIAQMSLFDYVNSITVGSIAAEMAFRSLGEAARRASAINSR